MSPFGRDPAAFRPTFTLARHWGAAEWCEGFLLGSHFDADAWMKMWKKNQVLTIPFAFLGTTEGRLRIADAGEDPAEPTALLDVLVPTLVKVHACWLSHRRSVSATLGAAAPHRPASAGTKVGRNDPCPCGSGSKYKKCCGG